MNSWRSPSTVDREARRLPGDQRAQRAVERRRGCPRRSRVSLAIRLASESKPKLAMPTNVRAVDLADVERRARAARRATSQRRGRVGRDPEHAREVVAAPAGQDRQQRAASPRSAPGDARRPARRRPSRRPPRRARRPSRASSRAWSRLVRALDAEGARPRRAAPPRRPAAGARRARRRRAGLTIRQVSARDGEEVGGGSPRPPALAQERGDLVGAVGDARRRRSRAPVGVEA